MSKENDPKEARKVADKIVKRLRSDREFVEALSADPVAALVRAGVSKDAAQAVVAAFRAPRLVGSEEVDDVIRAVHRVGHLMAEHSNVRPCSVCADKCLSWTDNYCPPPE